MTSHTPVVWSILSSDYNGWTNLDSEGSLSLENVFNRTSNTTSVSLTCSEITDDGQTSTNLTLDVERMMWGVYPVRRCKTNNISTVEFWDNTAWVRYDVYATALIVDAVKAGHKAVTFFMMNDAYHIDLENWIQTNVHTDYKRAVRLPNLSKVLGAPHDDGMVVYEKKGMPNEFFCPITNRPMSCPVVASDGHSYEMSAITQWFTKKITSPVTGVSLATTALMSNHALRKLIRDYASSGDHSTSSTIAKEVSQKKEREDKNGGKETKTHPLSRLM